MDSMFKGCSSIKYFDLSHFNTSKVSNMNNMFQKCGSMKVLDISKFDFGKIKQIQSMFQDVNTLKYVNIYNIGDELKRITSTELNVTDNLIVCQSENFLTKSDVINKCCYKYDIENDICEEKNYAIVYYSEEADYMNGFEADSMNEKIPSRVDSINYIINGDDDTNRYSGNQSLKIKKNSYIKIFFKENITNLESFFDSNYDENVFYISSIDLSHLESSFVTNMYSMFSGCSSLKSIDLSNINTSLVTDMNSLFSGCSSLESIDLSNFDTSLVTNMNSMFYGCKELKSIDLS